MINFLKNAPQGLKTFDELFRYATNLYKQQTGVFPEGIDKFTIRKQALDLAEERGKVVDLPTSNIKNPDKTGPTVDLSKYTNEDLNKLAEEGDQLAADLSLVDQDGASTLPYREFQEKSARLEEINKIIRAAQESKLPDSYFDRPRDEGGIPTTIEGKTKNMSAEEIMDFLMNKGKGKDTNIGTAPKTTKKKPKVDPTLQESEDKKQLFTDFESRNKTKPGSKINYDKISEGLGGVKLRGDETFDELLEIEKNLDKPKKAQGGRIGFFGGGDAGFAGNQMEGDQYTMGQQIPGSPQVPMGQFGPVNVGIFGGGGYSKNQIVPGVDMATTNQNYGIVGQFPIGNTGFTLGADYMKSRANERFTGEAIPGQTFKNVPTDSDRFNIGINFRKQFKDGSKPKSRARRNFLKLMAGLGSIPFVGPLFKGAKTVEKAATAVETVPPYFFQLVNKIRQFGTDITSPGVTTESRQRVTQYEIDGDDYVMTENLSTGKIEIEKEKIGGVQYYDEYGEMDVADGIMSKEYMTYKPKEVDVDPKTGKKIEYPEEYEEVTATPSGDDGTDMEAVSGLNDDTVKQIVKETGDLKGVKKYYPDVELTPREILDKRIQEIIKQRNKKAGGGVAYMLGE